MCEESYCGGKNLKYTMKSPKVEQTCISEINHEMVTDILEARINYYITTLHKEREAKRDAENKVVLLEKEVNSIKDVMKQMVWRRELYLRETQERQRIEEQMKKLEVDYELVTRQLAQFQVDHMNRLHRRRETAVRRYRDVETESMQVQQSSEECDIVD